MDAESVARQFLSAEGVDLCWRMQEIGWLHNMREGRRDEVDDRHREKLCIELGIARGYVDITEECPTEEQMRAYVLGVQPRPTLVHLSRSATPRSGPR